MWSGSALKSLCTFILCLLATPALARSATLTADDITSTLAGAILELDTPVGTKIPVRFTTDGLMSAEAGRLAFYLGAARDRGRWWTADNRLCMKWFRWFDAESYCMSLRQQGNRIFWQEQGGRSGTATVAGRFEDTSQAVKTASANSAGGKQTAPAASRSALRKTVREPERETRVAASAAADEDMKGAAAEKITPPDDKGGPMVLAASAAGQPQAYEDTKQFVPSPRRVTRERAKAPPLPMRRESFSGAASGINAAAAPVLPAGAVTFRVIRVDHDDVLNVRSGPSRHHSRVGAISPQGRDIHMAGPCRALWCPIRYGRVRGWVNSFYLAADRPAPAIVAGAR